MSICHIKTAESLILSDFWLAYPQGVYYNVTEAGGTGCLLFHERGEHPFSFPFGAPAPFVSMRTFFKCMLLLWAGTYCQSCRSSVVALFFHDICSWGRSLNGPVLLQSYGRKTEENRIWKTITF